VTESIPVGHHSTGPDDPIFLDPRGRRRMWLRLTAGVTASSGVMALAACGLIFTEGPSNAPSTIALPVRDASPGLLGDTLAVTPALPPSAPVAYLHGGGSVEKGSRSAEDEPFDVTRSRDTASPATLDTTTDTAEEPAFELFRETAETEAVPTGLGRVGEDADDELVDDEPPSDVEATSETSDADHHHQYEDDDTYSDGDEQVNTAPEAEPTESDDTAATEPAETDSGQVAETSESAEVTEPTESDEVSEPAEPSDTDEADEPGGIDEAARPEDVVDESEPESADDEPTSLVDFSVDEWFAIVDESWTALSHTIES
jgi:hypothetical protein